MPFSNGFLLSLSLCLDIGIANIAMLTLAMQRGFWQGMWLGLGTCVGDLLYALAALAGMTVLLQFETVRWVLWVGGSLLLVWFAVKMLLAAIRGDAHLDTDVQVVRESPWREFLRGIFLAMSSPSAILWFAAVGGVLISRSGAGGPVEAGLVSAPSSEIDTLVSAATAALEERGELAMIRQQLVVQRRHLPRRQPDQWRPGRGRGRAIRGAQRDRHRRPPSTSG